MIVQFFTSLVTLLITAFLLLRTQNLGYSGRVCFVFLLGLACAISANIPYWNWWHFSTSYTAVTMAESLIGSLLSALVLAYFVNPEQK